MGRLVHAIARVGGVVGEGHGRKLGDGSFMIPTENLEAVVNVLDRHNVAFDLIRVYLPSLP